MKKLLFASIIMMGFSAVAAAQTSDALKAKKAEARKQAGQPSFQQLRVTLLQNPVP